MVGNHALILRPATPLESAFWRGCRCAPKIFPRNKSLIFSPPNPQWLDMQRGCGRSHKLYHQHPLYHLHLNSFSLAPRFRLYLVANHGDSVIRNDSDVGWLLSLGDEFKSNLQGVICSYNQTYNSLTTIVPNYHEPPSGEKNGQPTIFQQNDAALASSSCFCWIR